MKEHYVLAYGTLKTGQPNYHVMNDKKNGNAKFIGNAKTIEKYPLVIASRYNIPFLINKPGLGMNIHGEVYLVDDQMLLFLDEFEGHPNYYIRMEEKVILEDGRELCPWIYFLPDSQPHLLHLKMISNYSTYGEHGLPYVERWERDHPDDGSVEQNDVIHEVKIILQ